MVTSVFISGCTNHRALKTIHLISFLNPCVWMDQSGGYYSGVFIVWYKHGQEPIRLHELSQVCKNLNLKSVDILKKNSKLGFKPENSHAWDGKGTILGWYSTITRRQLLVLQLIYIVSQWLPCSLFYFILIWGNFPFFWECVLNALWEIIKLFISYYKRQLFQPWLFSRNCFFHTM